MALYAVTSSALRRPAARPAITSPSSIASVGARPCNSRSQLAAAPTPYAFDKHAIVLQQPRIQFTAGRHVANRRHVRTRLEPFALNDRLVRCGAQRDDIRTFDGILEKAQCLSPRIE